MRIKNLAYIIYDNTIIEWGIIELCETNANKANMIDLGKKICVLFEKQFTMHFDEVIIENQIGPSAIRMKNLQGMITMYFIQKGAEVVYWNSGNKLRFLKPKTKPKLKKDKNKKDETDIVHTHAVDTNAVDTKTSYKERKKMSILITECIIKEKYANYLELFTKHKKKDDLADCFLQGLWFLKHENKMTYADDLEIKIV